MCGLNFSSEYCMTNCPSSLSAPLAVFICKSIVFRITVCNVHVDTTTQLLSFPQHPSSAQIKLTNLFLLTRKHAHTHTHQTDHIKKLVFTSVFLSLSIYRFIERQICLIIHVIGSIDFTIHMFLCPMLKAHSNGYDGVRVCVCVCLVVSTHIATTHI